MSGTSGDQADSIKAATESQPLQQRLMPQTSIRFFLTLIAVCAVGMLIFQSAAGGSSWSRIVVLLMFTTAGCFTTYLLLFLLANLFAFRSPSMTGASSTSSVIPKRDDDPLRSDREQT